MVDENAHRPGLVIIPAVHAEREAERLGERLCAARDDCDVLLIGAGSETNPRLAQELGSEARLGWLGEQTELAEKDPVVRGLLFGLERGYAWQAVMEACPEHQPAELSVLIDALDGGADLVSAIHPTIAPSASFSEHLGQRGAALALRGLLALPFEEPGSSFRVFRRRVVRSLGLEQSRSSGTALQLELCYRAFCLGFRVVEVPLASAGSSPQAAGFELTRLLPHLPKLARLRLDRLRGKW